MKEFDPGLEWMLIIYITHASYIFIKEIAYRWVILKKFNY